MQIGDRIKILRKDLNLTQAEFAERMGLKQAAIGLWENGTRNVTDRNVFLICDNFGVNEEWLCDGKGEMYRTLETDYALAAEIGGLLKSDDEWTKNAVLQFLKLPSNQKQVIKNFLSSLNLK